MSSPEYFITFCFLLLALLWIALIAYLTVRGAYEANNSNIKTSIVAFVLAILVIIAGIAGWHYITNQPGWEFLKTPVCAQCNSAVDSDEKFCGQCGATLTPNHPICEHCDAPCEPTDKYCSECGQKIAVE